VKTRPAYVRANLRILRITHAPEDARARDTQKPGATKARLDKGLAVSCGEDILRSSRMMRSHAAMLGVGITTRCSSSTHGCGASRSLNC
jgi:methionyl-tRNA formyltransferase